MDRRQFKAAQRADASGSGPTLEERAPVRFPGLAGAFSLFGEMLMTGLLVLVLSLGIVTMPAALAAGIGHLRRYLAADGSPLSLLWRDFTAALRGGVVVGIIAALLAGILALDIDLAGSGLLPGGGVVAVIGWAGLIASAVALLAAAGAWTPELGWREAARSVPASIRGDVVGAGYLAATAFFVGLATWMLVPLLIPALGCAALAVVAIPERRRRRA
jgi:hypothetical protein